MELFSQWLIENTISDIIVNKLKSLLSTNREVAGYITGDQVRLLNKGIKGGVYLGDADFLRSLNCNSTFHTHPNNTDVPYPSGQDVVAVYMTNKPDLVVCQNGIWTVSPLRNMDWQEVERISNQFKRESRDYAEWKKKVVDFFKVNIKKIYNF